MGKGGGNVWELPGWEGGDGGEYAVIGGRKTT